jgi:hypothetical protein
MAHCRRPKSQAVNLQARLDAQGDQAMARCLEAVHPVRWDAPDDQVTARSVAVDRLAQSGVLVLPATAKFLVDCRSDAWEHLGSARCQAADHRAQSDALANQARQTPDPQVRRRRAA